MTLQKYKLSCTQSMQDDINISVIENGTRLAITISKSSTQPQYIGICDFDNRIVDGNVSLNNLNYQYMLSVSDDIVERHENSYEDSWVYKIYAKDLGLELFNDLYTIYLVKEGELFYAGIAFEFSTLYKIRYCLAVSKCITCCDISSRKTLLNLMFREEMLKQSIYLNLLENAYMYYGEILRANCTKISDTMNSCINGMCNIR